MVRESKGFRSGTRKKLKQRIRPTITKFLQEFKLGQNVIVELEPSSHKGMPYSRFKGKVGKIVEKRGKSYVVHVYEGKKLKTVISRPEHLKAL